MEQNKTYSLSKEDYQTLKAHWSKNYRGYRSCEMVIYNLLRDKPAKNGFVEKKKNIQGNDPWFGFREALKESYRYAYTKDSPWLFWGSRFSADKEAHREEMENKIRERFKERFGIEVSPPDLYAKLQELDLELRNE